MRFDEYLRSVVPFANFSGLAEGEVDDAMAAHAHPAAQLAVLVNGALENAVSLVQQARSPESILMATFARAYVGLDAYFRRWEGLPDRQSLERRWPNNWGITFGHYTTAGRSAADVAISFARCVRWAADPKKMARLRDLSLGELLVNPVPDARFAEWVAGSYARLCQRIDLAIWPQADLYRDLDSFQLQVHAERLKVEGAELRAATEAAGVRMAARAELAAVGELQLHAPAYAVSAEAKQEAAGALKEIAPEIRIQIPPERRSRPMTLVAAATLMGYKGFRRGRANRLKKHLEDNGCRFERVNRQTYIFDMADFPASAQSKLHPTADS